MWIGLLGADALVRGRPPARPFSSVRKSAFAPNYPAMALYRRRLPEEARSGPFYLRQPAIADIVVEAIQYNAANLGHYVLHAFVVMPNHVHLLATPALASPKVTKSLKGITSKRANTILAMTGSCFWQEESYDHLVRNEREFEKVWSYTRGEDRARRIGAGGE
jgi:REP element-mobilizing transposase RayT